MTTTNIYVLRLADGKYYVGKTDNVEKRYQQHLSGNGCAWTRKYKPISVDKTITGASSFDEDRYVKEYMSKYGIDNVRGGQYVEMYIGDAEREEIKKSIRGAKNLCMRCGRGNHWAKDCRARTDVHGEELYESDSDDDEYTYYYGCGVRERFSRATSFSPTCYRCGHEGHYSTTCYARRHADGYLLD